MLKLRITGNKLLDRLALAHVGQFDMNHRRNGRLDPLVNHQRPALHVIFGRFLILIFAGTDADLSHVRLDPQFTG